MDNTGRASKQGEIPEPHPLIEDAINNIDPMTKFHERCHDKFMQGVEKYGWQWFGKHPADEYMDEQEDSKNYLDELLARGFIDQTEHDYAVQKHFELHWWMQNVIKRLV